MVLLLVCIRTILLFCDVMLLVCFAIEITVCFSTFYVVMAERLAKVLEKLAEKGKLQSTLDALERFADTTTKKDAKSATTSTKRKVWYTV